MKKSNLIINLIYRLVHQFIILVIPLIITPYISRVLGVEGVGIYSFYYTIVLYFSYFAMLGISAYGNRSIAKIKNKSNSINKTFTSIYFLQIFMSIIIILIYLFFIFLSDNKIISSIMLLYLFSVLFDINWLYYGLEDLKIPILFQIFSRLSSLILIFIFVRKPNDLWLYTLIKCMSDCIANIFILLFSLKKVKFVKVSIIDIKKHLKPCLLLFIPVIAASIYQHIDKVMLGVIINKIEVGYYEAANKLIVISLGIITAILSVISPKLSNLYGNKKKKEYNELFDRSLTIVMMVGVGIAFGIVAIANDFVPLFFGVEYMKSINLTVLLSIIVIFISWSNTFRWLYFIPQDKDKVYVKSVVFGAVINLVLNFILIPFYNVYGAAISTILAEFSVVVFQTYHVFGEKHLKLHIKNIFSFIFFAFIMMLFIKFVINFNMPIVLLIIFKVIVGFLIYLIFVMFYLFKVNKKKNFF